MSEQRPQDDLIGKQIGQYEIIEEIGRGGMATVYRARQKSMNRTVAIKVLPRHLLHDPGFFERFEREVDVIAHLEHPHILPTYDYGQSDNVPYIVMRFLGGGSLERMIKSGPVSPDAIDKPLRQIAQALDYAHQQGVIHRDIKPGNIMLDEAGNAYLSDFGIARVLGSEMTGSMIIGTPAYMSPEQANGIPIDGRADIYALGVVLFELLTGEEPHRADTPMAVLLKHINEPIPPLRNYRDDIPDPIEDVIMKATAKSPEDRFASASEMAQAYTSALRGEPSSFEKPTNVKPVSQSASSTRQAAVTTPLDANTDVGTTIVKPPSKGRSPLLYVGGFIALLLIGGIIGAFALSSQSADGDTVFPTNTPLPLSQPFAGGEEMTQSPEYRIVMLRDWVLPPLGYVDRRLTDDNVILAHRWRDDDNFESYVELQMLNADMPDVESFRQAIIAYESEYLEAAGTYRYLDESIAPNGSVVRSFETIGVQEPDPLANGQTDFVYMNYGEILVIFSAYSAYDIGNDQLQLFNAILDSLSIRTGNQLADPRVIGNVEPIGEPAWSVPIEVDVPADDAITDDSNADFVLVDIDEDAYEITVPREFILEGSIPYTDISDDFQAMHVYQIYPEAFAIVAWAEAVDISTEDALNTAIDEHIARYYDRDTLTLTANFVDEIGRHIRVFDFAGDDLFGVGQITLVYFPDAPFLTMMELYNADEFDAVYTDTLNAIVDSFELTVD